MLLTGDPLDPRFDPPTQEEQDYYAEMGFPEWEAGYARFIEVLEEAA